MRENKGTKLHIPDIVSPSLAQAYQHKLSNLTLANKKKKKKTKLRPGAGMKHSTQLPFTNRPQKVAYLK